MDTNLVIEGLKFMALGMGTVFSFLIILILMMSLMSRVVNKLFPEATSVASNNLTENNNTSKIIAAITAAVKHHKEG